MLLTIKNVLSENQLKVISTLLSNARFEDGKLSAGKEAKKVKNNSELSSEDPIQNQLNQMVMPALLNSTEYQISVFPTKVATPFYAKYEKGMHYGYHIDDPIMGGNNTMLQGRYRSDVSTTVFLNDEYEGGELVISSTIGEQSIKLNAGDAIVYPSSSLHKVNEVNSGERYVAVTWAQSCVKDPMKREMLYELATVRESLFNYPDSQQDLSKISNVYSNLLRRWSEL